VVAFTVVGDPPRVNWKVCLRCDDDDNVVVDNSILDVVVAARNPQLPPHSTKDLGGRLSLLSAFEVGAATTTKSVWWPKTLSYSLVFFLFHS
jgi:hypothetical protein